MGNTHDHITPDLGAWIGRQRVFFVATAPLAGDGHVNCSPKGLDTLRIVSPHRVAYLDLTGSGAETIAHVRENGRIVFMFCAFDGPPKIVRFHGTAEVITPASPTWAALRPLFPDHPGARSIIDARIARIGDSCGFGVPRFGSAADRDDLQRWTEKKGADALPDYHRRKNARSLDGLPALDSPP